MATREEGWAASGPILEQAAKAVMSADRLPDDYADWLADQLNEMHELYQRLEREEAEQAEVTEYDFDTFDELRKALEVAPPGSTVTVTDSIDNASRSVTVEVPGGLSAAGEIRPPQHQHPVRTGRLSVGDRFSWDGDDWEVTEVGSLDGIRAARIRRVAEI